MIRWGTQPVLMAAHMDKRPILQDKGDVWSETGTRVVTATIFLIYHQPEAPIKFEIKFEIPPS